MLGAGDMNIAMLVSIVVGAVVLRLLWWWFVGRNSPKFPPLQIADDDPAMLAAMERARATLPRFRTLFAEGVKDAQVKVRFLSNAGEVEHLWAAVLKLSDSSLTVRYLTPPVTHSGKLERVHDHPIADVEDWAAITQEGAIHGGYTQRLMFSRARESWGKLPRGLAEQESRYVAE